MTRTNETHLIRGGSIVTENGVIHNGWVFIKNGKIQEIGSKGSPFPHHPNRITSLSENHFVFPGFIDVHIHGANGADVMDGTNEALETMTMALPKEGTTSFLATTITQSDEQISHTLQTVATYMKKDYQGAEILGIHLEGPFISKKYAGAQPLDHIVPPNVELFAKWNGVAEGAIRLVTLAPEEDNDYALIKYLKNHNIIPSVGHSHATFDEMRQAVNHGLSHATHLFNSMRLMHHREPGVVGAVFLEERIMAEIIFDQVHVSNEMIKLAFLNKGSHKIQLITDAMRAKCLKSGIYDLGGQHVTLSGNEARLIDGTLAGSVLAMNEAVKNACDLAVFSLEELAAISSGNAAKELGVFDRKGSIAIGKDADLAILDEQFNVLETYCRGHKV